MFSFTDLLEMLRKRFKGIPNVQDEDLEVWLDSAYSVHGLTRDSLIPPEFASLVMLHTEADGAGQVALMTAYYFSFTDKDESVDKSMISESYRKISNDLWERYHRMRLEGVEGYGAPAMHYMHRLDRVDN